MSTGFKLTAADGAALTSTCRTCGAAFTHPNHSVHLTWRTAHALECTPPDNGNEAA